LYYIIRFSGNLGVFLFISFSLFNSLFICSKFWYSFIIFEYSSFNLVIIIWLSPMELSFSFKSSCKSVNAAFNWLFSLYNISMFQKSSLFKSPSLFFDYFIIWLDNLDWLIDAPSSLDKFIIFEIRKIYYFLNFNFILIIILIYL